MLFHSMPRHPGQIEKWNDTRRDFHEGESIIDLLDVVAAAHPSDPAIRTTGGVALTHGELASESSMLAHGISAMGVLPRTPVALLVDHVPEAITAIHAIARTGAFYVPLDPRWPIRRSANALRSIGIRYVIVTEQYIQQARQIDPGLSIIIVRAGGQCSLLGADLCDLPSPVSAVAVPCPDDLAYTIFTSGSTGMPKAVAVRHKSVVNLIEWFNIRNSVCARDILLQIAPFSFDLSVYDAFGVLAAGASILMLSGAELEEPEVVATALIEHQVTLWNSAPAMFAAITMFLTESSRLHRNALRRVFLSGDWIPLATPQALRREFPNASLVALGGATEACVWSNDFVVAEQDPSWKSIPYGNPMQNSRYYVLRDDLTPCSIDEAGELYIAGVCVAAGYLNDPVLTAERFLPDPWGYGDGLPMYRTGDRARWTANGWVEFLGRIDSQVKIRGFRIELGEIEYAAQQLPEVEGAVAVAAGDPRDPFIALALKTSGEVSIPRVAERLNDWLPRYMHPSRIVTLPSFPVTATGKVDRTALRKLLSFGSG